MKNISYFEEHYQENMFVMHTKSMNYNMPLPHIHDGYELHFTLTDDTVIQIDNTIYNAKAGSITVINDNEIHKTVAPQGVMYERIVMGFRSAFVFDVGGNYPEVFMPFKKRYSGFSHCLHLEPEQKNTLYTMLLTAQSLLKDNNGYCAVLKQKLHLMQILIYVSELYITSDNKLSVKRRSMSKRVSEIIQYIDQNLGNTLLLDDLVERFFTSKTSLIQMFKDETLLTPNRYIAVRRIMKSREYILEGLPINVVCNLVGYNDPSSFTRVFKQVVGCTPKKYAERI